ncbi:50S ribosomal protein L13 [Methanopyrus sp. KOL6]|uniref:50S ribosomal protein L13 n=1 Tax=Methanopyrus sp. KOL6 TaxID=1937004 RepID=UPI000B4BC1A0
MVEYAHSKPVDPEEWTVIDAENAVLGRLASVVAKRILKGERIAVINTEKAIITGKKNTIKEEWLQKIQRGDPKKGPFYPRRPDLIFRRVVRGMLPWKTKRGREAFKRLRAYIGTPRWVEEANIEPERVAEADMSRLGHLWYITLGELSEELGYQIPGGQ